MTTVECSAQYRVDFSAEYSAECSAGCSAEYRTEYVVKCSTKYSAVYLCRVCLAHRVVQALGSSGPGQDGREAREAAREGLQYMYQRVGGSGGVICVDREGRFEG